jgi:hypothetical protein
MPEHDPGPRARGHEDALRHGRRHGTVAQALERMLHVDTKSLIVRKRHDDDESAWC